MKALELTVYPKLKWPRRGAEIEPFRKQWKQERKVIEAKRFKDAELAAEWHANESEAWRYVNRHPEHFNADHAEMLEDRETTLRRFATLPHYDEADR